MRSIKAFAIVGSLGFLATRSLQAQTSAQVHGVTQPQVSALQSEKATRTEAQKKMSSALLDALKQAQTGQVSGSAPNLTPQPLTVTPEGVMVDIKATVSEELLAAIRELGGKVINRQPEYKAIRASMPLERLETLAARADVLQIVAAIKGRPQATQAEGDVAHTANLVRLNFGVRGDGVKIGLLSDSIDDGYGALERAYASTAMDRAKLFVLKDEDGIEQAGDGTGEGLAMAEIIHAIAPNAEVYFATADGGPGQMAANIKRLARQGCRVIVDDYTYFNESPFQDGPISLAVNEVSSQGVLYFSSARNSGNKKQGTSGAWEGDFRDGGPAEAKFRTTGPNGRIHVFDTSTTRAITLNTVDKASRGDRVDLFWSDPLERATNDYDLFVVNAAGQVVRSSTTSHTGQQDPYQSVEIVKQGESIIIVKEGNADARFLHLDTGRAILRYNTNGSVRGHNASGAENAFSVAAVPVPVPPAAFQANPDTNVESFSSDGPRRIFFGPDGTPLTPGNLSSTGGVLLRKPDITAADHVTTTVPGLNPFSGTSAAAPHAAAIAALLLSCRPSPTPTQVRTALQQSALGIDGTVPNTNAGYGIIIASTALPIACPLVRRTLASDSSKPTYPQR
jgi:subtilisin family serine protease